MVNVLDGLKPGHAPTMDMMSLNYIEAHEIKLIMGLARVVKPDDGFHCPTLSEVIVKWRKGAVHLLKLVIVLEPVV
jgi:hypothetical protein